MARSSKVNKKAKEKLDLLTNIDTLLVVEKGIRDGICHAIHQYAKVNNKYMKDHDKNNRSWYLMYCDVNNLYGWAVSQNFPVASFVWVESTFKFKKYFIKSYNEDTNKGNFLLSQNIFIIPKYYMTFTMISHF